jgi:threonine aldolase
MRQAMAHSIVGDDIYGDDQTTNLLQNQIAKICGKEASLFVPTGT